MLSDLEILDKVRSGDTEQFGILWERHSKSLRAYVGATFPGVHAEDVVAESFAETLAAITRGSGPHSNVRAYLYRAARNAAISSLKENSRSISSGINDEDLKTPQDVDATGELAGNELIAESFQSLTTKERSILWYMDVEGLPPREVAAIFGMRPNTVSVSAHRARKKMQSDWFRRHAESYPISEECKDAILSVALGSSPGGALIRANGSHWCPDCEEYSHRLREETRVLSASVVPAILGSLVAESEISQASVSPPEQDNKSRHITVYIWILAALVSVAGFGIWQAAQETTKYPTHDSPGRAHSESPGDQAASRTPFRFSTEDAPTKSASAGPNRADAPSPTRSTTNPVTTTAPGPSSSGVPTPASSEALSTQPKRPVAPRPASIEWGKSYQAQIVRGTGTPNSSIELWIANEGGPHASAPVDASGNWIVELDRTIPGAVRIFSRTIQDGLASSTHTSSLSLKRPRIPTPTIEITSVKDSAVSGRSHVDGMLTIVDNTGEVLLSNVPTTAGSWQFSLRAIDTSKANSITALLTVGTFRSSNSAPAFLVPRIASTYSNKNYTSVNVVGIPGSQVLLRYESPAGTRSVLVVNSGGNATAIISSRAVSKLSVCYSDTSGHCNGPSSN